VGVTDFQTSPKDLETGKMISENCLSSRLQKVGLQLKNAIFELVAVILQDDRYASRLNFSAAVVIVVVVDGVNVVDLD